MDSPSGTLSAIFRNLNHDRRLVFFSTELLNSRETIVELAVVVSLGVSEFELLFPHAPSTILENRINPTPTIFFISSSNK